MKKFKKASLSLSKETILRMTPMDLSRAVRGGAVTDTCLPYGPSEGWSDGSVCPTTTPTNCKPCSG
jgi:hypothetical protein